MSMPYGGRKAPPLIRDTASHDLPDLRQQLNAANFDLDRALAGESTAKPRADLEDRVCALYAALATDAPR